LLVDGLVNFVALICHPKLQINHSMNIHPRSGPTPLASALTRMNEILAVVFPSFRPCLLMAATVFILQTSVAADLPAFVPKDAEFQKNAKWLQTYTAALVATNRSTYKDGRTADVHA
jgi:hypothetical protein